MILTHSGGSNAVLHLACLHLPLGVAVWLHSPPSGQHQSKTRKWKN